MSSPPPSSAFPTEPVTTQHQTTSPPTPTTLPPVPSSISILNPPPAPFPNPPLRRTYSKNTLLSLRDSPHNLLSTSDPIRKPLTSLPTEDVILSSSDLHLTFSDLSLPPYILRALTDLHILRPSPIQLAALPIARLGVDIIAQAKSGTGKTLVFGVTAAELACKEKEGVGPKALILVPTRELARQVRDFIQALVDEAGLKVVCLIGGVPERMDVENLSESGVGIVVGTPGRVVKMLERGALEGGSVKLLVLDEVDVVVEGGMGEVVANICQRLEGGKQSLAFSATFVGGVEQLLRRVMKKPRFVKVGGTGGGMNEAVLLGIRQEKAAVEGGGKGWERLVVKIGVLRRVLQGRMFKFCMVFLNDKKLGARLAEEVRTWRYRCKYINADVTQKNRVSVMDAVKKGKVQVLVATDLLARGVDIVACDVVVQLDVPPDIATYLHRVGRAGRFGKKGLSVLVYRRGKEETNVERLEKEVGFKFKEVEVGVDVEVDIMKDGLTAGGKAGIVSTQGDRGKVVKGLDRRKSRDEEHVKIEVCDESDMNISERTKANADGRRKTGQILQQMGQENANIEDNVRPNARRHVNGDNDGLVDNQFVDDMEGLEEAQIGENAIHYNEKTVECGCRSWYDNDTTMTEEPTNTEAIDGNGMVVHTRERETPRREDSSETWDDFAQRGYDQGYKEGYEQAYRMAKELGARLNWNEAAS